MTPCPFLMIVLTCEKVWACLSETGEMHQHTLHSGHHLAVNMACTYDHDLFTVRLYHNITICHLTTRSWPGPRHEHYPVKTQTTTWKRMWCLKLQDSIKGQYINRKQPPTPTICIVQMKSLNENHSWSSKFYQLHLYLTNTLQVLLVIENI